MRWLRTGLLAGSILLLAGCGSGASSAGPAVTPTTTTTTAPVPPTTGAADAAGAVRITYPPGTFAATDADLEERVRVAGLSGGIVRIGARDGTVIHERAVGAVTGSTPLAVASSTKWLTAATFMTLVDQGAIGLDDDIARWLPEFDGSRPPITPRMLMSHTSGVRDNPCQESGALAACVRTLATAPREFTPGSAFSYGNSPFLVVGRLVEVLGGADFATVTRTRLTGPLDMDATTWPGAPVAPNPAYGVRTSVDDYAKFLAMILADGVSASGTRILSPESVTALTTNQVAAYDTSRDYSVGITRIPRYALGAWPDVVDPMGRTVVVSGNGGKGFYPWVDRASRTYGIVGVQDDRGAASAVPASQRVAVTAWSAVAP